MRGQERGGVWKPEFKGNNERTEAKQMASAGGGYEPKDNVVAESLKDRPRIEARAKSVP